MIKNLEQNLQLVEVKLEKVQQHKGESNCQEDYEGYFWPETLIWR